MRVFGLILFATGLLFSSSEDYLLVSTKQFTVQGTTSIGGFECNYDLKAKDTLFFNKKNNSKIAHTIPVKQFGCGNFMLNHDFRKTLKAKEYPEIKIELLNFKKKENQVYCDLSMELVGKQKTYKNLTLKLDKNKLKGDVVIFFNEFDLTPPKKMGGMVKVKDEIKLSVCLLVD
ncbi:hypothetical protein [Flavobacterium sp.]|jgi:hypothetical protein|uniref:hypothetical protein n=1 Tax=Flavobacterium sp. TaxID=239 RepID=UPI002FDA6175